MKSPKIWKYALVALSLLYCTQAAWGADREGAVRYDPDVDFRWAMAAIVSSEDGKRVVQPVTRDLTLKSGDQLKMMIQLETRCFVYVFHHNSQDGVRLLFPYSLQQFGADYRVHHKYYVPRGEAWFKLDQTPSRETFYLLASARRLNDLEADYQRYESAPPADKAEAARVVLEKIRALRKEHREFTTPAEKPVRIGGAVRGVGPREDPGGIDIAALADEVSSSGFVARTYTIEHQ